MVFVGLEFICYKGIFISAVNVSCKNGFLLTEPFFFFFFLSNLKEKNICFSPHQIVYVFHVKPVMFWPCSTCRSMVFLWRTPVLDNDALFFHHLSCRKSLDLVESLLRLSEVGQYEQVKQLFGFPIKHCPDMLVLALLQISTSWHTLRHELISTLMPIFLGNHPNSAIILHYAWHGQVGSRNPVKFDTSCLEIPFVWC